jgi:prevent-host-death family protein
MARRIWAIDQLPGISSRFSTDRDGISFTGHSIQLGLSVLIGQQHQERPMRYVSATEAKQELAAILDAAQREPVVIRRQQRSVAVVLSMQEYERLTALNVEEFQRFCDRVGEQAKARGLTEEKLSDIIASAS